MILVDVNLLVYAHDETSKYHPQAKAWWENQLNGSRLTGLSWVGLLGFIRLLTNPRIFDNPFTAAEIVAMVEPWLELPHVKIIHPSDRHFAIFADLIKHTGMAANLTTDTHLATLAIERGLILNSNDADFARFPGLKWHNPLG